MGKLSVPLIIFCDALTLYKAWSMKYEFKQNENENEMRMQRNYAIQKCVPYIYVP